MNHGKQCVSLIIVIFLYQGYGFGQQFYDCPQFVLLSAVFQPQLSVFIGIEVFFGNGYGIYVCNTRITGEKKQIPCKPVGSTVWCYLHITDFLKTLTAQCPRCLECLFRKYIMLEEESFGMSLIVGFSAYFLDDGKIVACGIYGMSFFIEYEVLIIMDELFGKLSECQVLCLELGFDELP